MRIRLFLSALLLTSMTLSMQARYITEGEALANAKSFMSDTKLKTSHNGFLKLAHKDLKAHNANYYVFSKGDNEGFVVVSGSDKTDAIFGYVDNGNFDASNLPENFAYWLDEYSRQVEVAEAGNYVQNNLKLRSSKTVAPLLKDIMWNQSSPYNDKCPLLANGQRCASGCVATAFAQIMYYYRWPDKGVGSKSYTSESNMFDLSANFGATTYRWDAMTPYYNSGSSEESRDAVAELMFHVGVASEMDYGPSSGAATPNAVKAMAQYFKYDKRISCIYRDFFSRDEWDDILKNELDNKRPISYAGSNTAGHQFVLDGYDANGMFHVNWGWGGSYDGYYKISVLNPEGQGIGGSDGGYNNFQCATVGMMKPDASVELPEFPYLYGQTYSVEKKTVTQGENFTYKINDFYNYNYKEFEGYVNLGFFNNNNELVAISSQYRLYTVKVNYGWGTEQNVFNAKISNLADGTYEVCPIEKLKNEKSWKRSRFSSLQGKTIATVSGNTITFENKKRNVDISVSDIVIEESYEGIITNLKYTIHNNGDEYDQPLKVAVCDNRTDRNPLYFGEPLFNPIVNGESLTVEAVENFGLKAGDYVLTVIDAKGYILANFVDLKILPKPADPNLVPMALDNKSEYHRDDFEFNLDLVNYGGIFKNKLYLFIYNGKELPQNVNNYSDVKQTGIITLPGGSTSSKVNFKFNLLLDEGDYYVVPAYQSDVIRLMPCGFTFKLVEGSGVEIVETDNNAFTVYPNPVEDVLNLNVTGNLEKVSVFNMNGALVKQANEATVDVSNLAAGNYIIIAEIDGKPSAKTFIKK